jgi:hypothetical protein
MRFVFMCFVWFSEQAILVVYSITWLVFVMEMLDCLETNILRDRQYTIRTYNVTLRRVLVTIFAMEKK